MANVETVPCSCKGASRYRTKRVARKKQNRKSSRLGNGAKHLRVTCGWGHLRVMQEFTLVLVKASREPISNDCDASIKAISLAMTIKILL